MGKSDFIETAVMLKQYAKRAAKVTHEKGKLASKRQVYEDTIWALLSTKEFLFNH